MVTLPPCPCCKSDRLNTFQHRRFLEDHIDTIMKVQCMECGLEGSLKAWLQRANETTRQGFAVAPVVFAGQVLEADIKIFEHALIRDLRYLKKATTEEMTAVIKFAESVLSAAASVNWRDINSSTVLSPRYGGTNEKI